MNKTLRDIVLATVMGASALTAGCEATAAHFYNTLEPKVKQEHMWRVYEDENGSYDGEVDAIWSEGGYWRYTPNGKGTWKNKDGDVYEGEFLKGDCHGYGKITFKGSGTVVEGYWSHGRYAGSKKPNE